jgi:hypothetical protein
MIDVLHFPSKVGIVKDLLNLRDLQPVIDEIKTIIQNTSDAESVTWELAGQIDREFALNTSIPFLENLILPYLRKYNDEFKYMDSITLLSNDCDLILKKAWVNFQKKHEYNPMHDHTGVFSFVIWLNIPYTQESEIQAGPGKHSNSPGSNGQFTFYYTTGLGDVTMYKISCDREKEGMLMVFPAELNHSVNPFFSSDDYRITVSGNFFFKV